MNITREDFDAVVEEIYGRLRQRHGLEAFEEISREVFGPQMAFCELVNRELFGPREGEKVA